MSCLSDGADILSLFLDAPEVFDEGAIVDELIDFFGAATQTTTYALQTMFSLLIQRDDVYRKVRAEFNQSTLKTREQMKGQSIGELLKQITTIE